MEKEQRQIAPKNYVFFVIMCILTVFIVVYLGMWYDARATYYRNNSIMSNLLSEIHEQEVSTYVLENPDAIIYVVSSKDGYVKNFEKKFRKLILKYNLNNQFIYIDSSINGNLNNEFRKLPSYIGARTYDLNSGVNIIVFENGKIKALFHKDSDSIDIEPVENFLEAYGVIEE